MNHRPATLRKFALAIGAASACLMGATAFAAGGGSAEADLNTQYKMDIARCTQGTSGQDLATCKQEAGAALAEARRNRLVTHPSDYQQNMTRRCQALPTGEQQDCLIQMRGENPNATTTTQGSVAGGGILRQTEITIPGTTTTKTTVTVPETATPAPIITR